MPKALRAAADFGAAAFLKGTEFGTHLDGGYNIRDFAFAVAEVVCKRGCCFTDAGSGPQSENPPA